METLAGQTAAFLILFARTGAVLMLLPVFSEDAVPARTRLLMALGMSTGLWSLLSDRVLPAAQDGVALPTVVVGELLIGLGIGMIVKMMFQAIAMAGSIISLQIGLSSALVADPSQGGHAPLVSKFVAVAAAVACMAMGIHHLWIASLVQSYVLFPVAGVPAAGDFARLAVEAAGQSMSLAIGLAAPLLVYGLVFNVALGLSARLAPAIQVFFIAQPLNILLGTALLAVVFGAILNGFAQAMSDWTRSSWT